MINEGMLLASCDDSSRDHSRVNCEEFVRCQVRANETYSEAKRQFCGNSDVNSFECSVPS